MWTRWMWDVSVAREKTRKRAKALHTMDAVDLTGLSSSVYSPGVLAIFKASAPVSASASASLRFLGLGGHHYIDREAVLAAIDGPPICPLLELKDLPPTHYVRKANGGRECVGVFVNKEVCKTLAPVLAPVPVCTVTVNTSLWVATSV